MALIDRWVRLGHLPAQFQPGDSDLAAEVWNSTIDWYGYPLKLARRSAHLQKVGSRACRRTLMKRKAHQSVSGLKIFFAAEAYVPLQEPP